MKKFLDNYEDFYEENPSIRPTLKSFGGQAHALSAVALAKAGSIRA